MKSTDSIRINSLEDLHAEIRQVKQRIKAREEELGKRWSQVPGEAVKATVGAVLPVIIGDELSSVVWKLLKGAFELIKGKNPAENEEGGWKDKFTAGAKKLGLFAALKLLFNLWKGK